MKAASVAQRSSAGAHSRDLLCPSWATRQCPNLSPRRSGERWYVIFAAEHSLTPGAGPHGRVTRPEMDSI